MQDISHRIWKLVEVLNGLLPAFSEAELAYTPGPGRWSRKEILGHLIDSAMNNHRRFVLSQLEPEPLRIVAYDQREWVALARYQYTPTQQLLQLWTLQNQLLARLLAHLPAAATAHRCEFDNGYSVTLRWLAEDYVMHLEHHVQQIKTLSSV